MLQQSINTHSWNKWKTRKSQERKRRYTQNPNRDFYHWKYNNWKFKNSLDGINRKEMQEKRISELENKSIKYAIRHGRAKLLTTENEETILKAQRNNLLPGGKTMWRTTEFYWETMEARSKRNTFKLLKEKTHQTRILYPTKILLRRQNQDILRGRETMRILCQDTCYKSNIKRHFSNKRYTVPQENTERQGWKSKRNCKYLSTTDSSLESLKCVWWLTAKNTTLSSRIFNKSKCKISVINGGEEVKGPIR